MSYFKTFCKNLNDLCVSMQVSKETVDRVEAERALAYAKTMDFKGAGDVLLFCASVNLMNTYVKQPGCRKFGYSFKANVPRVVDYIRSHPVDGVRCNVQMDGKNSLTIVEICGVQFSFHCVQGVKPHKGGNPIKFDGIRKQKCAITLFKLAEANQLMRGKIQKSFPNRLKTRKLAS